MLKTTGINKATAPVELINADKKATKGIINSNKRTSLVPPTFINHCPAEAAKPVRKSPSPTTNSPAIITTTGMPKPDTTSFGVKIPESAKVTTTISATISMRIRSQINRATVIASNKKIN